MYFEEMKKWKKKQLYWQSYKLFHVTPGENLWWLQFLKSWFFMHLVYTCNLANGLCLGHTHCRHSLLVWNGLFGVIGGEAPPIITIGWPLLTILVLVGFRYVWNGLCGGSKFLAWYLPLDMVHVRAKDIPTKKNIRSAQI